MKKVFLVVLVIASILSGCGRGTHDGNEGVPVADAGPDQGGSIMVADAVILDGSGSRDPYGFPLAYSWTMVSRPDGSQASLSDSDSVNPSFIADVTGKYIAELVVRSGVRQSKPDRVSITVTGAVPVPAVSITSPADLSIFTDSDNPITVTGTVNDPGAAVTVNGVTAGVDTNGGFTLPVLLTKILTTITANAKNIAGEATDSIQVGLIPTTTGFPPTVFIHTPEDGYLTGGSFGYFTLPTNITVSGVVVINALPPLSPVPPAVNVNGVVAVVTDGAFPCPGFLDPHRCWGFTAALPFDYGVHTVTAQATDSNSLTGSDSITVNVDLCYNAPDNYIKDASLYWDPGAIALAGDGQNARCHEIDGCSTPQPGSVVGWLLLGVPGGLYGTCFDPDNPTQGYCKITPVVAGASTQFGQCDDDSGNILDFPFHKDQGVCGGPGDRLVHGLQPLHNFPCNHHDICYQTCIPRQPGETDDELEVRQKAAWKKCNDDELTAMNAVCRTAYPEAFCPFTGLEIFKCPLWRAEKTACFAWALVYYGGDSVAFSTFKHRQNQYCAQ
jgi:hypothetical protein